MNLNILNELIEGKISVTPEIALLLESTLDIPAKFWMDCQSQYESDLTRIKELESIKVRVL